MKSLPFVVAIVCMVVLSCSSSNAEDIAACKRACMPRLMDRFETHTEQHVSVCVCAIGDVSPSILDAGVTTREQLIRELKMCEHALAGYEP